MKNFFLGLILVVFFSAIGGLINYIAWVEARDWWTHRDMAAWKTAPGELTVLELAPVIHRGANKHYDASCTYSFTVEGTAYEGHQCYYPASGSFTEEESGRAYVERDFHLTKPVWTKKDTVLGPIQTLAKKAAVTVHYYPADPSVSVLSGSFGNTSGNLFGTSIAVTVAVALGMVVLLIDAAGVAAIYYGVCYCVTSFTRPAKPSAPKVLVAADICDRYIPLLDEGIAATHELKERLKEVTRSFDVFMDELTKQKTQALNRKLTLAEGGIWLTRRFDYEWTDNKSEQRFVLAITALDEFYNKNLVLKPAK